jgi:hypothetical protein
MYGVDFRRRMPVSRVYMLYRLYLGTADPSAHFPMRSDVPGWVRLPIEFLMLAVTAVVSFREFSALSPLCRCDAHVALEGALESGFGLIAHCVCHCASRYR